MRLHYYTPAVSRYCVGVHNGHGFGSIFARLFSKVAAKAAAKTALNVAKSAGKKALKVAAKKGAELAKEAAKEGLKQLTETGKELATEGIKTATEKALLNTKLPPAIVHSVHDLAQKGVDSAAKKVAGLDLDSAIDKGAQRLEGLGNVLINKSLGRVEHSLQQKQPEHSFAQVERKKENPRKRKAVKKTKSVAKRKKGHQTLTSILAGDPLL